KNYWTAKVGGVDNFDKTLQEGIIHPSTASTTSQNNSDTTAIHLPTTTAGALSSAPFTGNVADAASKIGAVKGGETEVVFYQKVSLGTGTQANNPWLQELPDPITK